MLEDAHQKLENWGQDYNHFRPHSALADVAPAVFARQFAGVYDMPDSPR